MSSVIWWIRRDLRLHDNQALRAALDSGHEVMPVFILDSNLIESPYVGEKRLAFLWAGLNQLNQDLQRRGSRLIVRKGPPEEALKELFIENEVGQIFAEADFTPYARKRDSKVASQLPLQFVGGSAIGHPDSILKSDGTPYVVFTPYMRAWKMLNSPEGLEPLPTPSQIPVPRMIQSEPIPSDHLFLAGSDFQVSQDAARRQLQAFTEGSAAKIYKYSEGRNQLDVDGTARISPYLRFGMLSAREVASAAFRARQSAPDPKARDGAETWLNELIWRDFYISILYHFPKVLKRSFRTEFQGIPWQNSREDFVAWCEGRTGYPVVDAAMRQLLATGWMHNRARMIVGSFLVKHLLVDWRWGERWFMQQLLDGDPASNNGGWQWTAGTGTDAAPYFRIFNPILQSKKFDPHGAFIRYWLPELSPVPLKYLHTPWELPSDEQKRVGCIIGSDYPMPIIEHSFARQRALDAYRSSR